MQSQQEKLAKLLENPDPSKFDSRVHIRDERGNLVLVQPYKLHVISGSKYYERPVGSGNLWLENGQPAGRMVKGEVKEGLAHEEWITPKTGADKLYEDLAKKTQQYEAAMKELEAIKKEQKFKQLAEDNKTKGEG